MRIAPAITLSPEQRTLLESQARSRSLPVRVAERARIVLLAAAGQQDKEIAAGMAITPKKVARWRKRFLALGVAGLEKDAPRPGRKPTIGARLMKRVVTMTTRQKPANATQWSTRTMAERRGDQRGQRAAHLARARPEAPSWTAPSKSATIRSSPRNWKTSSAFTSTRPSTRWCCAAMKRARFRRWIERNRACR